MQHQIGDGIGRFIRFFPNLFFTEQVQANFYTLGIFIEMTNTIFDKFFFDLFHFISLIKKVMVSPIFFAMHFHYDLHPENIL